MGRTTYNVGRPGFILGVNYDANDGRQVDYDRVPDSFNDSEGNAKVPGGTVMSELGSGKIVPRSSTKGAITNLTETGETATATEAGHGREVGDEITITGAAEAGYNGTFTIASVPDANSYTFDVGATVADDAGGATVYTKASCILLTTALENDLEAANTGYGVVLGGVIFKTLLQETDDNDFDTWLSELKDAGTGFKFETYSDSRSS